MYICQHCRFCEIPSGRHELTIAVVLQQKRPGARVDRRSGVFGLDAVVNIFLRYDHRHLERAGTKSLETVWVVVALFEITNFCELTKL